MGEDYEKLLEGHQYAESRGSKDPYKAIGDKGASLGAFQMKKIMYKDIQRIYPKVWGKTTYEQMQASPSHQRGAARDGLRMLREHYKLSGDAAISGWNTGPGEARKGRINKPYVDTVKEGMRRGSPAMRRFK